MIVCYLSLALLPAGARVQDVPTLSVEGLEDVTDEGRAFVELTAERTTWYEGETVRLRLRLGLLEGMLEEELVQLFRRELDVPVQVQTDARLRQGLAVGEERGATLAFNGSVATATRPGPDSRGSQRYELFELPLVLGPAPPGPLDVGSVRARFARASGFEEDFLARRIPRDREDVYVTGTAPSLWIAALPETGRPPDFSGAIGRFSVSASATPRDLELGKSVAFVLTVRGPGSLEGLALPRLDELEDFAVLGRLQETPVSDELRVTYDLRPRRADVRSIPAVAFSFFDPATGAYEAARTSAIPILVRPVARSTGQVPTDDADTAAGGDDGSAPILPLLLVPGAFVLWLVARSLARRSPPEGPPSRRRIASAARSFREREAGADLERAYADFLGELLGCDADRLQAHELPQRLQALGVSPELARAAAKLLERLHAPRYGGPVPADAGREAHDLVAALERSAGG